MSIPTISSNDGSSRKALVGPTLTCQTSLLPLPFNQPLDCWNQRILRHRSKHPTVISLYRIFRARRISGFVRQSAYALSRYWVLEKRFIGIPMSRLTVITHEKNWINQRSSLHKARRWEEALFKGFDVHLKWSWAFHCPPQPSRDGVFALKKICRLSKRACFLCPLEGLGFHKKKKWVLNECSLTLNCKCCQCCPGWLSLISLEAVLW